MNANLFFRHGDVHVFIMLKCTFYTLWFVGCWYLFEMKPYGDEGVQYSKLITIAIHIAVKSGGRVAKCCHFICGTNTLKALFLEIHLCKYFYRINMKAS